MKTEKIVVSSNGRGMTMALDEVEAFSHSMGFDERSSMRARLLAEETMSMVRAIVEDFEADFWMELPILLMMCVYLYRITISK